MINNVSIFDKLKEFYDNDKEFFQDSEFCGINEFQAIHTSKKLKVYEQNRKAYNLLEKLFGETGDIGNIKEIEEYVQKNPVINYYQSMERIAKALCENENKKACGEKFIIDILKKSSCSELIKAALVIAPFAVSDIKYILNVYSIDNEYLFYVLNAYEYIGYKNDAFFQIAKRTKGYGRFFAVMHLKPVTYEITEWMIEEGSNNDVAVSQLIYINMLSINLLEYMNKTEFSEEKIEKLSKSFSIMFSDYGLNEIENKKEVCVKLLEEIDKYSCSIYSLYAAISILYSLESELIEYYNDKKINLQMSLYENYKEIVDMCKKICDKDEWKSVLDSRITDEEIESNVIITCAEKIGYKIKKKDFETLFKKDHTNPLLYKYAFSAGNRSIKRSLYNLAMKSLKIDNLISGPDEFTINSLKYEDIEHICYFIMTKHMKYEDFEDEYKEFNMEALKSPLIETRIKAVENLQRFKEEFNESDKQYIKECLKFEMVGSVKRGLKTLITDSTKKQYRTVSVEEFYDVTPHVKDTYLTSVCLDVCEECDYSRLFNRIQEDDIVYMVQDPDEKENIVAATNNGIVIGNLPKFIKEIMNNMICKGKYFYGKIESISDDCKKISVSIIMSYKDVLDDIGDTIMLLSNENDQFVQ